MGNFGITLRVLDGLGRFASNCETNPTTIQDSPAHQALRLAPEELQRDRSFVMEALFPRIPDEVCRCCLQDTCGNSEWRGIFWGNYYFLFWELFFFAFAFAFAFAAFAFAFAFAAFAFAFDAFAFGAFAFAAFAFDPAFASAFAFAAFALAFAFAFAFAFASATFCSFSVFLLLCCIGLSFCIYFAVVAA